MNRTITIAALTFALIFGLGAVVYGIVYTTHSQGHITITSAGNITVPTSIEFGTVSQGVSSVVKSVAVHNTVSQVLTLSIVGSGDGVTYQLTNSGGTPIPNIPLSALATTTVYIKATVSGTAVIGEHTHTITFNAS